MNTHNQSQSNVDSKLCARNLREEMDSLSADEANQDRGEDQNEWMMRAVQESIEITFGENSFGDQYGSDTKP